MFDLKKPCRNCPFKKGQGELFNLGVERCLEIFNAPSFQCHKTIDYDRWESERGRQGDKPQQCVGVMSLLHRANLPSNIMRVAERIGHTDFSTLDHSQVYDNIAEALEAHSWGEAWDERLVQADSWRDRKLGPRLVDGPPTRAIMTDFVRAWERRPRYEGPL